MHTKRVVVWLRLVVVSPRHAGHRAARLVLLMLKAPGPGWPGPNAAPSAAPNAAPSPGVAWGWRWTARHSSAPAPRGAARVQFKRRPAARLRLVGPAGRQGGGFDPRRRRDHDLPSGRVGFGASLGLGLPGLPTTRRHALSALQFSAVVSCGPPLNTPPISSGTVPKEEPSHTLGDSSQGLPTGLLVQTPGGIDPSVNVLSTSAYCEPLTTTATDQQTSQWLQKHRFGAHLRTFNSFCGADLLRLTRDDLIQICGLADGIRLFNALHSKSLTPALTIYLTHASLVDDSKGSVFRALYLNSLNCGELSMRLAAHVGLSPNQIADIFIEGPGGIRVLITNEVVQHMKNEGLFAVELCQEHNTERFCLLLKPTTK